MTTRLTDEERREIRRRRRNAGHSSLRFARLVGLGEGTVANAELGNTDPRFSHLRAMVRKLGGDIIIQWPK